MDGGGGAGCARLELLIGDGGWREARWWCGASSLPIAVHNSLHCISYFSALSYSDSSAYHASALACFAPFIFWNVVDRILQS